MIHQITWSKNGKAISSSEIMDLKYKNGVATLTINEVFPEDEGVYTCTATNSIGSTETSSKLTIQRKYRRRSCKLFEVFVYVRNAPSCNVFTELMFIIERIFP